RERLAHYVRSTQRLLRQLTVRLQHHPDRFLQIFTSFFQCFALGVRAGQFLDERSVALPKFSENGCQLDFHADLVARNPRAGQLYLRLISVPFSRIDSFTPAHSASWLAHLCRSTPVGSIDSSVPHTLALSGLPVYVASSLLGSILSFFPVFPLLECSLFCYFTLRGKLPSIFGDFFLCETVEGHFPHAMRDHIGGAHFLK